MAETVTPSERDLVLVRLAGSFYLNPDSFDRMDYYYERAMAREYGETVWIARSFSVSGEMTYELFKACQKVGTLRHTTTDKGEKAIIRCGTLEIVYDDVVEGANVLESMEPDHTAIAV